MARLPVPGSDANDWGTLLNEEVLVEMSGHKIDDEDALLKKMSDDLRAWKKENSFPHLIKLALIPMHWKIDFDI